MIERVEDSAIAKDVASLERLAVADPPAHTSRLAWELGELGDLYRNAGIEPEWLACYQRAAGLVRERVAAPDATDDERWDLQQHVFNLASVSLRAGERSRTLAAINEALERVESLDPATGPPTLFFGSYLQLLEGMREACRNGDGAQ